MENVPVMMERVQELTWALLDEQITEDEMQLLDNLLLSDDAARRCYFECIRLHVDLMALHAAKATPTQGNQRLPILSFPDGSEALGFVSPAEDLGK